MLLDPYKPTYSSKEAGWGVMIARPGAVQPFLGKLSSKQLMRTKAVTCISLTESCLGFLTR
jgi:hypothetical protein